MISLTQLLFPTLCIVCEAPDRPLCDVCLRQLSPSPVRVHAIGASLPPIVSAGVFESGVADVIRRFKETGQSSLARELAPRWVAALEFARETNLLTVPLANVVFVAPPPSPINLRARGFDPLRVIARWSWVRLSRELVPNRVRYDQRALSVGERQRNLSGSLRTRRRLDGVNCIVLDDVVTTGATVREVTRALSDSGATVHLVVVLAHTQRRIDGPAVYPQSLL